MFDNSNFGNALTISIGDNNVQNVNNKVESTNNLKELSDFLISNGFSEKDVDELKTAIIEDGVDTSGSSYGTKVLKWSEKILIDVKDKFIEKSSQEVQGLVKKALLGYFGF